MNLSNYLGARQPADKASSSVQNQRSPLASLILVREYHCEAGVCRYDIWTLDYKGKMSVKDQGCYGEILPPDNSVGELIIHEPDDYSQWFFCYE